MCARPPGRFFLPDEDATPGTHPVVVLSHKFWTDRFKADPAIVGQTIRLNNVPYTVVGVAEPGFTGTTFVGADFWAPMAMDASVSVAIESLLDRSRRVVDDRARAARARRHGARRRATNCTASCARISSERNDSRRERWGVAVARSARVPAPIAGPVVGFIAMLGGLTGAGAADRVQQCRGDAARARARTPARSRDPARGGRLARPRS